jgi:integrase
MARKIRSELETRTARLKRPVVKKPAFVKIGRGISLGYRRNTTAGTWVVRVADGKGSNWTKAIGLADDYDDANGSTIFDYWQAQDRAKAAARTAAAVVPAEDKPPTLGEALDQYEADLKTRGGDAGNAVRVRRHLSDKQLDAVVSALTLNDLRTWRDGLTAKSKRKPEAAGSDGAEPIAPKAPVPKPPEPPRPLAPSGVNRLCTALKAALNLAADRDERIASRRPWEQGLATLPDAEESRNVILPDADIRKLVEEAPAQGTAFATLLEGLAVTGARVSQLARISVGDLQDDRTDPRLMVPSSRKGNGKKAVLRRPVPIAPDFAKRLRKSAEGKPADAPLFGKDGGRWRDTDHARPFARVVKAAGVTVEGGAVITSYALRHSSIVRQLLAGVPVRVVAALHDTSVAMLERTYSRFIGDHSDAMTRAAMFSAE